MRLAFDKIMREKKKKKRKLEQGTKKNRQNTKTMNILCMCALTRVSLVLSFRHLLDVFYLTMFISIIIRKQYLNFI